MRVVASRGFSKAAQLRELLLYLAKQAILSPSTELTEQEIGNRVLGRRPDYDPQEDNIVRVQIRHLRHRLQQYFAAEGRHEPMVITIPKGSRLPCFESQASSDTEIPRPLEPEPAGRVRRWLWVSALALALVCVSFYLGRASSNRHGLPSQNEVAPNPLLNRLFASNQETTIVIADASLAIVQDLLQTSGTLNDYINRSFQKLPETVPDKGLRSALQYISARQYTSLADTTFSGRLYSLGRQLGARVSMRYARHMNIRDFNTGNYVLVGSKRSVPWVELFEPNVNFVFEKTGPESGFGFRNRKPIKGESEVYASDRLTNEPYTTYATVTLLPNTSRTGIVLLLNGVTMEATEAAGEFATSGKFSQLLLQAPVSGSGKAPHFIEVLLRVRATAGAPHQADIVAWRTPSIP